MKVRSKTASAFTFIFLILVAHLPRETLGNTQKQCVCVTHKSLCKKPPSSTLGYYATAAGCLAPLGLAVASGPILGALGFTAGGIAGGSVGAWLMSLSGGSVVSGSMVALLQSWGAAGVGTGVWAAAGTMVTSCLAIFYPSLLNKYSSDPDCESSTDFVCFFNDDYAGSAGYDMYGSQKKPSVRYPEGKKVPIKELYASPLYLECDLQQ